MFFLNIDQHINLCEANCVHRIHSFVTIKNLREISWIPFSFIQPQKLSNQKGIQSIQQNMIVNPYDAKIILKSINRDTQVWRYDFESLLAKCYKSKLKLCRCLNFQM